MTDRERFEKWVAEHGLEAVGSNAARLCWKAGVEAEREACAKVCDDRFIAIQSDMSGEKEYFLLDEIEDLATAMRQRSNAK